MATKAEGCLNSETLPVNHSLGNEQINTNEIIKGVRFVNKKPEQIGKTMLQLV